MIRLGILSDNGSIPEPVRSMTQFKEIQVVPVSFDPEQSNEKLMTATEKMISASDGIYYGLPHLSYDLIKLAIRSSVHLFCSTIPRLTIREATELTNLENEAGCIVQILHPYIFQSQNLKRFQKLQSPFFFEMRIKPHPGLLPEDQLILLLLFLIHLDSSIFPKVDVHSLEGEEDFFVLDMRLTFSSGSVAHIMMSPQLPEKQSLIEIFQKNQPMISFQSGSSSKPGLSGPEQNAIRHFIKAINKEQSVRVSMNDLFQALQILEEIRGKLKIRGSLLLS